MHVALSTFGTAGDIIPFARIARSLLERGHRVTVHSWQQFASWFPDGVEFAAMGGGATAAQVDQAFDLALRESSPQAAIVHFCRMFYGLGEGAARARAHYAGAREALAGHDLALVNVLDHVSQAAANELALPWASYSSRPPPDATLADRVNEGIDAELGALIAEVTGHTARVHTFREVSRHLAFAACSAHIAPPLPGTGVIHTGAWLAAPTDDALPDTVEQHLAGGPCLFATFGVMPDVRGRTEALVAAAALSGWRAIVQVLPPVSPPADVPDGVLLVTERLPFSALLPRVAAVVHHGSVGTTHEVARAGRPSLAIPHMGDQFFWGFSVHQLGLGPAPVRFTDIGPQLIAQRMTELRAPAYASRAQALAPAIAAEDGVSVAVERLEAAAAKSS